MTALFACSIRVKRRSKADESDTYAIVRLADEDEAHRACAHHDTAVHSFVATGGPTKGEELTRRVRCRMLP